MKTALMTGLFFLVALSASVWAEADNTTVSSDRTVHHASESLPQDPAMQDRRNNRKSSRSLKSDRKSLKANTDTIEKENGAIK